MAKEKERGSGGTGGESDRTCRGTGKYCSRLRISSIHARDSVLEIASKRPCSSRVQTTLRCHTVRLAWGYHRVCAIA